MRSAGRFARRRGVGEQGTKVPAFARRERPPGIVTALILLVIGILATSAPSPAGASTTPGQLFAFGRNVFGQLGNTTNNNSEEPNPTPTPVTLPGEDGPVTQAAAGVGFSLAVTSSGQLYAFGENRFGQLGTSTSKGHTRLTLRRSSSLRSRCTTGIPTRL